MRPQGQEQNQQHAEQCSPYGRFCYRLRVRYSEIDGQQVVYNSRYLEYIDAAIIEYVRHIGLDYVALSRSGEFDFVLVKTTVEFKTPAVYDDILDVWVSISHLGNKSFTARFYILRADTGELLVEAENVYACYDPATHTSYPIPPKVREAISRFECG